MSVSFEETLFALFARTRSKRTRHTDARAIRSALRRVALYVAAYAAQKDAHSTVTRWVAMCLGELIHIFACRQIVHIRALRGDKDEQKAFLLCVWRDLTD